MIRTKILPCIILFSQQKRNTLALLSHRKNIISDVSKEQYSYWADAFSGQGTIRANHGISVLPHLDSVQRNWKYLTIAGFFLQTVWFPLQDSENSSSVWREIHHTDGYNYYQSDLYSQFYLGLKRVGDPKNGNKTALEQVGCAFLTKPAPWIEVFQAGFQKGGTLQ